MEPQRRVVENLDGLGVKHRAQAQVIHGRRHPEFDDIELQVHRHLDDVAQSFMQTAPILRPDPGIEPKPQGLHAVAP